MLLSSRAGFGDFGTLKKILFRLFIVIAIAELFLMVCLNLLDFGPVFFWLPMLLDALLISITAILTVSISIKKGLFSIQQQGRTAWVEIQIGLIVFFIEIFIMQMFELQPWNLTEWHEMFIDAFVLAFLSSLGIYFIALKPAVDRQTKNDVTTPTFDSTEATVIFSYLSIITVFLMFMVLNYQHQFSGLKNDMIESEVNSQKLFKTAFVQQLNQVISDVLSISQQSNVTAFLLDSSSFHRQELVNDFLKQATFKTEYDQLRLLDITGQELIRIEQRKNEKPVSVDSSVLQNKSNRYYFTESLLLKDSEVFLSRIDLNKEFGKIELPYKPVIRVSTTVMFKDRVVGVVVLNLKAKILLDTLTRFYTLSDSSRQLLDEDGHWVFGGDGNLKKGFVFIEDELESLVNKNNELWGEIQNKRQGVHKDAQESVIFQSIGLNGVINRVKQSDSSKKAGWYLVSYITNDKVDSQLKRIRIMMVLTIVFIILLLGIGTYLLILALRKKKSAENKIMLMVYSDALTGLKNRKYFQWKLIREIESARQQKSKLAILYIDLDNFKIINDEMGHEAGDLVLKKVSNVLLECLREDDTVARIGGDEFAAILPSVNQDQVYEDICSRIISQITYGLDIGGMNFHMGINIGIATMNNYNEPIRSFIARADQAMYESKASKLNKFVVADKYIAI